MTTAGLGASWATLSLPQLGARAAGERLARIEASPLFVDGRAQNLVETSLGLSPKMWDAMRDNLKGQRQEPEVSIPVETPAFAPVAPQDLQVTWMGHSTLLLELEGVRVLTDPVFSDRASPFSWAGPKRFHAPPLALAALPELDAVVISHDHYDHLDYESIRWLGAHTPVVFVVPLGVGAHLERWGVPPDRIVELEWWEEHTLKGVRLVSTPARHFSGRGPFDRFATLWSSWALIGERQRAWFSGDTGPFAAAAEIGERLGPFDLTCVESGAWNAAWPVVHLGPDEALAMHHRVQGKVMMPVHWGTFKLAPHAWDQPFVRLRDLAAANETPLLVPVPGQTQRADSPAIADFWKAVGERWDAAGWTATPE